ncbi:DUF441 domain-containing protein [Spirabiliibacterium falconis]|uniref:DUF441 domain-containing protein n=1 Tax=Spirabiliibacterium falconis TaxID=572023 RepID=UPI001AAD6D78|nr:DUF441 domain-containing protein [Spirabiliibacterium falconis]MBE2894621.1 DUF441 domain-containing protein [Spirabiliibacterium falconis]
MLNITLSTSTILLLALFILGILSHNNAITIAAITLLLIAHTPLISVLPWVEKSAVNIGIIILTIGVLSPLVSGKVQLTGLTTFFSWKMLLAIGIGLAVAWLGGRGVNLMQGQPEVIPGLIIGTVAGVAFLKGVPVGPLIAAGLLSLFLFKQ